MGKHVGVEGANAPSGYYAAPLLISKINGSSLVNVRFHQKIGSTTSH